MSCLDLRARWQFFEQMSSLQTCLAASDVRTFSFLVFEKIGYTPRPNATVLGQPHFRFAGQEVSRGDFLMLTVVIDTF